jgi:hypothetical protein
MSIWLWLSLIANVFLLGAYLQKKEENRANEAKLFFWKMESEKWRDRYYRERDNKDW